MAGRAASPTEVLGRERELAALAAFVDNLDQGPRALVIEGQAGIGKSTLWQWALARADHPPVRALRSRPGEAETNLAYAGLGDLLEGVIEEASSGLAPIQLRAIEIALLRAEPDLISPDQRTVSVGALGVVRRLAEAGPVLLAVDDLQWLDPSSVRVLTFVMRRLVDEPVGVLLTVRSDAPQPAPLGLERALGPERVERLVLVALGRESITQLLRIGLGLRTPPALMRRIVDASGGNPLLALEIGRAVARSSAPPTADEELPLGGGVRGLMKDRLARLPSASREVVLVASALTKPTVPLVLAATPRDRGQDGIHWAVRSGVIEIVDGSIRFSHPLLASVAYAEIPPTRRRALHGRLVDVVPDPEERARHLALSARGQDELVAAALDEAASGAAARGAPDAAAQLLEWAERLTPADGLGEAHRRAVRAAENHFDAGDLLRARTLLERVVAVATPGTIRARALWRLGVITCFQTSYEDGTTLFNRALSEAGDDSVLAARIRYDLSWSTLTQSEHEEHGLACLDLATRAGDRALIAAALTRLAAARFYMGQGLNRDDLDRAVELASGEAVPPHLHPNAFLPVLLSLSGDLDGARRGFLSQLELSRERGDETYHPFALCGLAEVEWQAGDWQLAETYAAEGLVLARETEQSWLESYALACVARLDACRGRVDAARAAVDEGWPRARGGSSMDLIGHPSVLGFLELSLGNPAAAHALLGPLSKLTARLGFEEPAVLPFVPDDVEALIAMGELTAAKETLEPFQARAREVGRPWALAAAARCDGLLAGALGDLRGAVLKVADALALQGQVGQPFEHGRSLLAMGAIHRRVKHRARAREFLEQALGTFERLGAPLWATRAREELARIGGRTPSRLALTEAERRVAALVAEGHSNREAAQLLFVSENTVRSSLQAVYRKLGVRSRLELARRWVNPGPMGPDRGPSQ